MSRVKIEIVKETAKAKLARVAGVEAWVQGRFVDANNTVSDRVWKSALENAKDRNRHHEVEKARREFERSMHLVKFVGETEAAIACEVEVEAFGFAETRKVWLPKSKCQPGEEPCTAYAPGWLIRAKEAEACNGSGSSYYERHRAAKGEFAWLLKGIIR